jgi:hypothetical protein
VPSLEGGREGGRERGREREREGEREREAGEWGNTRRASRAAGPALSREMASLSALISRRAMTLTKSVVRLCVRFSCG